MTVSAFAKDIGVSRKHLSDIVNDRARVTPAVAVRLAHALGTSAALWVNLQAAVDVFDAEKEYGMLANATKSRRSRTVAA